MWHKRIAVNAGWVLFLAGASLPRADGQSFGPAKPVYVQPSGVYAKIDIEDATTTCTTSDYHSCVRKLYKMIFANTVISGITVGEHWDHIQLSSPACLMTSDPEFCVQAGTDWTYLDDAFAAANPQAHLVRLPGAQHYIFNSNSDDVEREMNAFMDGLH